MTMPPELVRICCPKCGYKYEAVQRGSINRMLDNFDDAYIEEMTTSKCPNCKVKIRYGLVVEEDGLFKL